jgi:hypothetical protein
MSCELCNHKCCINGESGIEITRECEECGIFLNVCTNELSDRQLEDRYNGSACGCGDRDVLVCEDCRYK